MALVVVLDMPGMTQAQYEQSAERLTGRSGPGKSLADWPVAGLVSHVAAPTDNGWLVVDVWESEEAFQQFGKILIPILRELGVPEVQPQTHPVYNVVTR